MMSRGVSRTVKGVKVKVKAPSIKPSGRGMDLLKKKGQVIRRSK